MRRLRHLYALHGKGYDYASLEEQAESIRGKLLKIKNVDKVEFFVEQPQHIYVNLPNAKLATLGISSTLLETLQEQNQVNSAGAYDSGLEHIRLAVGWRFNRLDNLRKLKLRANGNKFRLGDIAKVYRGFEDPPTTRVRFIGKESTLLGVAMNHCGDIIQLCHSLDSAGARITPSSRSPSTWIPSRPSPWPSSTPLMTSSDRRSKRWSSCSGSSCFPWGCTPGSWSPL